MSDGVTKICPICAHKNIVSYPKTICMECEFVFPIETLQEPKNHMLSREIHGVGKPYFMMTSHHIARMK